MSDTAGIGHNNGPSMDGGAGFRRYAWKRARRELVGARVPVEIVRLRVRRAKALGLAYPHYASILLGTGRDIAGFLFTVDGLQLRLLRELEAKPAVAERLKAIESAGRLALSPPEESAEAFRVELAAATGARIDAAAPAPETGAGWGVARARILAALSPLRLPRDAVVMIGEGREEERWAEAARLARFLPGAVYFGAAERSGAPVDSPAARA